MASLTSELDFSLNELFLTMRLGAGPLGLAAMLLNYRADGSW